MYTDQLAVIINSYNRCNLLKIALPAIEATLLNTAVESCIVIFEAGSDDGSSEFIEWYSMSSKVDIFCVRAPAGIANTFSGGCNYAVERAAKLCPGLRWCFFYETDNFISNHDALSAAIDLMTSKKDLAAVGFTVEKTDGSKAGYGQKFPNLWSFIVGQHVSHALGILDPRSEWREEAYKWAYCDIVYTSPLLVDYQAWKRTGGMDSVNFPFSDSDNDWCWRLKKIGLHCAVLDVTGVVHDNREQASSWSANRTINFHQARFSLLKKHKGSVVNAIKPLLALRHIAELLLLSGSVITKRKESRKLSARITLIKRVMLNYSERA